tara:strand:+ start:1081 stop:1323 length:243 start_codon:yes stop_codon:yes gene_type:complete
MKMFVLEDTGLVEEKLTVNRNYYSKSKQAYLKVSDMPEQHVRNALQKMLNEGQSGPIDMEAYDDYAADQADYYSDMMKDK